VHDAFESVKDCPDPAGLSRAAKAAIDDANEVAFRSQYEATLGQYYDMTARSDTADGLLARPMDINERGADPMGS